MRVSLKQFNKAGDIANQQTTFLEGSADDVASIIETIDTVAFERGLMDRDAEREEARRADQDATRAKRNQEHEELRAKIGKLIERIVSEEPVKRSAGQVSRSGEVRLADIADRNKVTVDPTVLFMTLQQFFVDTLGQPGSNNPAKYTQCHDTARMFMAVFREKLLLPLGNTDHEYLERYARLKKDGHAKRMEHIKADLRDHGILKATAQDRKPAEVPGMFGGKKADCIGD